MTHLGTVPLETERLILRRAEIADTEALFRNGEADPAVTRYMTWPAAQSVEDVRGITAQWVARYADLEYYQWVIVLKSLGEPIGVMDTSTRPHGGVGYWIGQPWWHQGYASEALAAVLKFMFEQVGVHRQQGHFDPRNPHSGDVMRKCGMRYEGTARQSWVNGLGEVCDQVQYAMLADDYFHRGTEPSKNYVLNLRRYVGHMPLILCAAGVILENEKGEILLQRRRDNGLWAIHGGAVEPGESVEDAAKRELYEETGLIAHSLKLLSVFSGEGMACTYPNGDMAEIISVVFVCRDGSGAVNPQPSEVTELRWFSVDALPEDFSPIDSKIIHAYVERRKGSLCTKTSCW
jgi:ribosomal-protein-alanine N-acetyltransferase